MNNIKFTIDNVTDSHVGKLNFETISDTIYLFKEVIISAIDAFLPKNGTNIENLIGVHGIGIDKAQINLHDKYTEWLLTPEFTVDK